MVEFTSVVAWVNSKINEHLKFIEYTVCSRMHYTLSLYMYVVEYTVQCMQQNVLDR